MLIILFMNFLMIGFVIFFKKIGLVLNFFLGIFFNLLFVGVKFLWKKFCSLVLLLRGRESCLKVFRILFKGLIVGLVFYS